MRPIHHNPTPRSVLPGGQAHCSSVGTGLIPPRRAPNECVPAARCKLPRALTCTASTATLMGSFTEMASPGTQRHGAAQHKVAARVERFQRGAGNAFWGAAASAAVGRASRGAARPRVKRKMSYVKNVKGKSTKT
jgi:hypothetical protein